MDYRFPGLDGVDSGEALESYAEEVSSYSENLDFDISAGELEGVSKAVTLGVHNEEWNGYTQIHVDEDVLEKDELGQKLYHEMVHSVQASVLSDYELSDLEQEYVEPLLEGQADHNSGGDVYMDGIMLYQEFLSEEEPGEGLESLSDSYAITDASVRVGRNGEEEKVNLPVTMGRDGSHYMNTEEVEMMSRKKYGYSLDLDVKEVDEIRTTSIDYRRDDFDSKKVGKMLREVQGAVDSWQESLVEEGLLE